MTGGSGVGTLSLLVPGELGIRYDATQLSTDSAAQPAGDLTLVRQGGSSTVSAPVTTAGPSAVVVQVADALDVAMGLRESGAGDDAGATAGTTARATAWVVLPAAVGPAARSGLVIANDGSRSISVELRRLPADGSEAGEPVTVTVGPGATASPPRSWLNQDPTAAVLLTGDGDFVALGSGATGRTGASGYATSLGVPLPSDGTVGP